jgi:hypothetical protein
LRDVRSKQELTRRFPGIIALNFANRQTGQRSPDSDPRTAIPGPPAQHFSPPALYLKLLAGDSNANGGQFGLSTNVADPYSPTPVSPSGPGITAKTPVPVSSGFPTKLIFLALLAALATAPGCNSVKRKILVRSYPEGALVTIDKQPIGHTPVAVPVTYYGTREIQLEMDGYQTRKVKHRFAAPWYQIPPFDFLTDNFWLREIRDDRIVDFEMQPETTVDENFLLDRAGQLRGDVSRGTVAMPMAFEQSREEPVLSEPDQTAILPDSRLRR